MRIILFLVLINLFIFGCQSSKKYDIVIKEYEKIGDNEKLMFSHIKDIEFLNQHLFVLDSDLMRLYNIDLKSKQFNYIEFKKGNGPGEFSFKPGPFVILSDALVIVLDDMAMELEFMTLKGATLFTKKLDFTPHDIFLKDDSIYVSGNYESGVISVFDKNGNFIRSLIPQFFVMGLPIQWFSEVILDGNNNFYLTNPYAANIVKWNKRMIWEYISFNNEIITIPQVQTRGNKYAMFQTDGWATNSIFVMENLLFASTFSVSGNKNKKSPHLFVLDIKNGNMILKKKIEKPFLAKSFGDGKYMFTIKDAPYPCIVRIEIKLKEQ